MRPLLLALAVCICIGCEDGGKPAGPRPESVTSRAEPMRRLSHAEYTHTLQDLLPSVALPAPELARDTRVNGFSNDARAIGASQLLISRYEETARAYAAAATADPAHIAAVTGCDRWGTPTEQEECGARFVRSFAARAFRHPIDEDVASRFESRLRTWSMQIDFAAAVELTLQAILQSPEFLYRLELDPGDPAAGESVVVGPYEMASRLSYALWLSMPDEVLFEVAASGALGDRAEIERQARRMLADPRAQRAWSRFHREWLELDRVLEPEHQTRVGYPDWSPELQREVHEETLRFLDRMLEESPTLSSVLTSREAVVSSRVAALYGVDGPMATDAWSQVTLPPERAGILTRVAVLASHAHPGYASPPLRGNFIRTRVLCGPHQNPPEDADTSQPMPIDTGPRTNRDLFEERTAPSSCQSCHVQIDGLGFGFEHFDAAGVHQTQQSMLDIDAHGVLVDTDVDGPYDGAVELSERLARSTDVERCYVRRWLEMVRGREDEPTEAALVEQLLARFDGSGGDVRELLVAIVTHPSFAQRRELTE